MNRKTKIIIFSSIYIISFIFAFFLGKNITMKKCKDSQIKIEEDLQNALSKASVIEKRNNKLLELNDKQCKINEELKNENIAMKSDLNNIKSIQTSTKEKLGELEKSADESTSIIKLLRDNNSILRQYFQDTSDILGE
jgi:hypothetical protein